MTKKSTTSRLDVSQLSIKDEEYTGRTHTTDGKYSAFFSTLKVGQRIVCPKGNAGTIAPALSKWLKRNGHKSPIVHTQQVCADGKGGVWWMGEKEHKPVSVWVPLKKAA